jgi:chemotaxis protein CheC
MVLNESQKDSLTELINIGYARAAGALSQLAGHRIRLEVPKVAIHRIVDMTNLLQGVLDGEVASVNQIFSGPISGNAVLLLDDEAALVLTRLLTGEEKRSGPMDLADREALTEVGNIVLNACLGVFGNLLKVQVSFSVPRLHVESVEQVLRSVIVADCQLEYALVIHTRFFVQKDDVHGYLVIVLGVTSLDRLLFEVKQWEERQVTT